MVWSYGQTAVLHYENDLCSIPAKVERLFVCIRHDELYDKDYTVTTASMSSKMEIQAGDRY